MAVVLQRHPATAMGRDHRKLRVFALADELVLTLYRETANFPRAERFGLQSQLRRAATSTACNIGEGSARRSTKDYVNFLNIAAGSAAETQYLVNLSIRLGFLCSTEGRAASDRADELSASLQALISSLKNRS